MRILIYGINYSPELTGIGKYTGEMGAWLAAQGHDVTVVTAPPYYPEWQVHQDYKGKWWQKENKEGVAVYRCPLYVPKKVTSAKRIIHEFTFLAALIPVWLLTLFQKRRDVVICINPPFHLGLLPLLYARLRGSKLITHIQDLQVDAAKDLGMIKNQAFLNLMFGTEKFILKNSDVVSTISDGMQKKIALKGISSRAIWQFPNWVDEATIFPLPIEQSLRKEFGINNTDTVILYSGNLGEKQGLEIIVEVAEQYKSRKDVHFLISGTGGGKEKLVQLVREAGLTNIQFHPLQPYEKLSALLATADIHLVLQKKSASDLVLPSKLTGILAAGGFALVTAPPDTSLYEVVTNNELAFIVEPESANALKEAIDRALVTDLGAYRERARNYAVKNLSKESILASFEEKLFKLI